MRLLLVEDNERFAALLKQGLAAAGFTVDVLATAADATAALRDRAAATSSILDLGLPDARRARRADRHARSAATRRRC